jgi:hypothetical protein
MPPQGPRGQFMNQGRGGPNANMQMPPPRFTNHMQPPPSSGVHPHMMQGPPRGPPPMVTPNGMPMAAPPVDGKHTEFNLNNAPPMGQPMFPIKSKTIWVGVVAAFYECFLANSFLLHCQRGHE